MTIPEKPASDAGREIVSRGELNGLHARMSRLSPELELTPGGSTEKRVNALEELHMMRRAHYIRHRLTELEGKASTEFVFAKLNAKSRHDFERSR